LSIRKKIDELIPFIGTATQNPNKRGFFRFHCIFPSPLEKSQQKPAVADLAISSTEKFFEETRRTNA